jgi:tetratricopeptide (TPR) repeat protein
MFKFNLFTRRLGARICLATMFVLTVSFPTAAVVQEPQHQDWKRALELYESQNMAAAVPLLERIVLVRLNDPMVLSRLGFALYSITATEQNVEVRKKIRDRARQVLLKSQANGDDSNLTKITLEALSQDEVRVPFTQITSAEAAIREGESAFVRGDLDKALAAYKRALELDPTLYDAAVYAGDSEFKKAYLSKDPEFRKEHLDQAGIWFAKAIAIDPNRETAYRYWGDALDMQGKPDDVRAKFVEAIVAEPYNQTPYMGLTQWGDRHRVQMSHPEIVIPARVTSAKQGEVTIALDDQAVKTNNPDSTAAWMVYGITRASWLQKGAPSEKFKKANPGESEYRHSLAEEVDALRTVAESAAAYAKGKKPEEIARSLANLIKLKDAGLLEAYVLFARADKGIAQDYAAYRRSNRDKLKRYWMEMVIRK